MNKVDIQLSNKFDIRPQ